MVLKSDKSSKEKLLNLLKNIATDVQNDDFSGVVAICDYHKKVNSVVMHFCDIGGLMQLHKSIKLSIKQNIEEELK